jgi:hypothetical protein
MGFGMGRGGTHGKRDSPVDELSVNAPVVVYPGTDQQQGGVIVEDFGSSAGHAIDIGSNRFVDAARRWAVRLNSGELVFLDSDQMSAL